MSFLMLKTLKEEEEESMVMGVGILAEVEDFVFEFGVEEDV